MPLINRHVLMSDAKNFSIDRHINPYYEADSVNPKLAEQEHETIKKMLEQAGVEITQVASPINCQDGVYTANWALVIGDKAILANLPNARTAEQSYADKILINLGKKIIHVPVNLKFSGQGDALPCGNLLFCGSGYRSDEAAQEFAAETLGYDRIQLHTIPQLDASGKPMINQSSGWPDSFFYDIDLAISIIKAPTEARNGLIAYCKEAFDTESQTKLASLNNVDTILVSETEAKRAFATNLVSTGETVVMSAQAPELAANLRAHGLRVLQPEIAELSKGGGYIRCVTLTLD